MNIQELIGIVARRIDTDSATAVQTIGTMLSIIELEGKADKVDELFSKLPGAVNLAQQYGIADIPPQTGVAGKLIGLENSMLGNGTGTLLAGISRLQSMGLSANQIKIAAHEVFVYATENAGRSLVREAIQSILGPISPLAV